jgi:hypothetical protein
VPALAELQPLALLLVTVAVGTAPSGPSFRMPSRNIACVYAVSALRCDILSGLRPEPRARCQLDWTGLTLPSAGPARPTCAGDTVYDAREPILGYGRTWRRGAFVCVSRRTGLECRNRSGRGFVLARESWRRV